LALTAVDFVRILPSGFEALLCHCPGLQREPLKAVRDHWRSQGGLELEGVEGEAALEDQLIEALETGSPTRCLLDRPADLFPRNRKLIDRLVVIADGCSCNPLYSQRLMRCLLGIPTVLVLDGAGEVHVDGGVPNNLLVDWARALSAGRVIAVTLDAEAQPRSGVHSIPKAIVDSMMCASHTNSLQVEAQASLMLRPDVCHYPFLDWHSYRKIHAVGYTCAQATLQFCK